MGFSSLHAVAMFARQNRHCLETTELLIAFKADVNCVAEANSCFFWLQTWTARLSVALYGYNAAGTRRKRAPIIWALTGKGWDVKCHMKIREHPWKSIWKYIYYIYYIYIKIMKHHQDPLE